MTGINDDDTVISDLITEAIDWLEEYTGSTIIRASVTAIVQVHNRQMLPYGPVSSVTTVNGNAFDPTNTCMFPIQTGDVRLHGYGAYTVLYEAGYDAVPPPLIGAINAYVAYGYEHRGDDLDETDTEFVAKAKRKAFPYIKDFGY